MRGFLRSSKFKGESKCYRVKGDVPIRNSSRINERRIKRLKNKLWRIYKRRFGIVERIKTHIADGTIGASKQNMKSWIFYTEFQQKWHEWKTKNQGKLNDFLKPQAKTVYKEVFNG